MDTRLLGVEVRKGAGGPIIEQGPRTSPGSNEVKLPGAGRRTAERPGAVDHLAAILAMIAVALSEVSLVSGAEPAAVAPDFWPSWDTM